MSFYSINIEERKRYLIIIFAIQTSFLLLLLKSFSLSIIFSILFIGPFFLFLYPEIGFAIALTDNILLKVIFDFIQLPIPVPALISYFVLMSAGIAFYHIRKDPTRKIVLGKLFWISIGIGLLMILGLFHSTDPAYGLNKILFYCVYNLPMILIALFYKDDFIGIEKLLAIGYILGIILGLICFSISAQKVFSFLRFRPSESVNPIFLARSLGVSFICSLFFVIRFRNIILKILIFASFPILVSPLIWSGSRAPLIGILGIMLLFYLFQPSQSVLRKVIVSSCALFVGVYFIVHFASQTAERMVTPLAQETSTALRVLAWFKALQDFFSSPILGIGTGSFLLVTPFFPLIYPHNLILELACEQGIIGLALITGFIFLTTKYGYQNVKFFNEKRFSTQIQLSITLFCLFMYTLWNSMFSGDITTNPVVWFSAGLIWVLNISKEKFVELIN